MSSAVTMMQDHEARPAWVRFERRAIEDKPASLREGKWVGKDADYVFITPPYSKDEVVKKVDAWLSQLDEQVSAGRVPAPWRDRYQAEYRAWCEGQELPVNGTPIKGWGMISPAQQEVLIHAKIRTVEDLAKINDEGMRHVGMGAFEMKAKATAWLAQTRDKGAVTIELAAVKAENAALKVSLDTLTQQVQALRTGVPAPVETEVTPITDAPKKRRGNPNWVKKEQPA